MFALVKYKNNGNIVALPVTEIYTVVKEDGVKTFVQFEPTGACDFRRSKHKKYVVFSEEDGVLRRWYITIGCLGASRKKVLKKASKVDWPPQENANESLLSNNPEAAPPMISPVNSPYEQSVMDMDDNPEDVSAVDAVKPTVSSVNSAGPTSMDVDETQTDDTEAAGDAPSQSFVKLAAFEEAMSLQTKAIRALEEQLQDTNKRLDACSKPLPDLENIIAQAIEGTVKNEFSLLQSSFDILHKAYLKLISSLQDIKKEGTMAHVMDWVNKIPTDLNFSMAVTDASKADVSVQNKKLGSSDDSVENLSESSTYLRFMRRQLGEGSTTTVSDEASENKLGSGQQTPTEIKDNAIIPAHSFYGPNANQLKE